MLMNATRSDLKVGVCAGPDPWEAGKLSFGGVCGGSGPGSCARGARWLCRLRLLSVSPPAGALSGLSLVEGLAAELPARAGRVTGMYSEAVVVPVVERFPLLDDSLRLGLAEQADDGVAEADASDLSGFEEVMADEGLGEGDEALMGGCAHAQGGVGLGVAVDAAPSGPSGHSGHSGGQGGQVSFAGPTPTASREARGAAASGPSCVVD